MSTSNIPGLVELALKERKNTVTRRLNALTGAGIPADRLYLVKEKKCRCQGNGVVLETCSLHGWHVNGCDRCLGVGMTEVVRCPSCSGSFPGVADRRIPGFQKSGVLILCRGCGGLIEWMED